MSHKKPWWRGPHMIFPAAGAIVIGMGVVVGLRTLLYSPDIKLDSKSRRSPLPDNQDKWDAYRSHSFRKIGRMDTYFRKSPEDPSPQEKSS